MARKPTGKPNGRPRATTPAPTKAAERSRQWRLDNPEWSRAAAIVRNRRAKGVGIGNGRKVKEE